MKQESAHVKTERAKLRDEWDKGLTAGYASVPSFVGKPVALLTRYERAYLFGMWMRQNELEESE